jgi:hypothetical protein
VNELQYKLYHFDGKGWVGHILYLESQTPEDIWGGSASNVYAVGPDGIMHYDGISWKRINDAGGQRVWATSPTDMFVPMENAVLHGTP